MKGNVNGISGEEVLKIIDQISARGNHAEVKKNKDGYIVYEVSKRIKCGK